MEIAATNVRAVSHVECKEFCASRREHVDACFCHPRAFCQGK